MSNIKRRNELEIAEDRAKVCRLLAMGYRSKTEIAAIINEGRDDSMKITPQQVAYDLEYMKNKYLSQGIEDFKVYRNQIVDELNLLKRTYWKGYELSRRNKISIESEAIVEDEDYETLVSEGVGLKQGEKVFQRMAKTREEQRLEGNVSFLQGVQACIDREAKIYGIDAPSKVALTDPSGTKESTNILDYMKTKMNELATKTEDRAEPKLLPE